MRKGLWPQSWQQRESTAGSLLLTDRLVHTRHHTSLLPQPLAIGGLGNKHSWAGKGVSAYADGATVVLPGLCLLVLLVPQFPHPEQSHLPVHWHEQSWFFLPPSALGRRGGPETTQPGTGQ